MSFADDLQERLHVFALDCVSFVRALPCTDEGREWGGQLRRASTAASAIYRASRRAKSKPDWLDKIADALEELDECDEWFLTIEDAPLAAVPQTAIRRPRAPSDSCNIARNRTSKRTMPSGATESKTSTKTNRSRLNWPFNNSPIQFTNSQHRQFTNCHRLPCDGGGGRRSRLPGRTPGA